MWKCLWLFCLDTLTQRNNSPDYLILLQTYMKCTPIIKKDDKKEFIVVCAWSEENDKLTTEYVKKGWTVSHGICPYHAKMNS